MSKLERAAMQQALEALEACVEKFYAMKSTGVIGALPMQAVKAAQAITALREALVEQAEQEPVKLEHITDGQPCWCNPELNYKDPETGAEVWVHKEPQ